jgi:hypothetical protein
MHPRGSRSIAAAALTAALAAALPVAGALAEPAEPTGRWVRAATQHFTFYSDADPEQAASVAADLERLRSVLAQIAPGGRLDSAVPIRLYLLRDEAGLARFRPGGPGSAGVAGQPVGYLVAHPHGVFGAALVADPELRSSRYVYKQYIHYVLAANLPELPLWFRQGLAELYSTFEVRGGEALIGLPVEEHVRWLRGRERGETLVSIQTTSGQPLEIDPEAAAFFPVSWATVHSLVVGSDQDRERVPGYLRAVVAGEDPEAAFRAAFGRGREEARAAAGAYASGDRFRYVRLPLASLPEPAIELTGISPAEIEYRLGDLLAHAAPVRRAEAAARFEAALALDPGHGLARAGLGWLAEVAGDRDRALADYTLAVGRAPDDFLVQHLYGDALLASLGQRRPADDAGLGTLRGAQAALRRATELAPGFPEAWARLGFALNLEPEASSEAVAVLERAVALLPARMDVAFNLLLAYARIGDAASAEALLAAMPARGADAATLARAREIRLQLAFAEANALVRADKLDEAADLLAWIHGTTRDPATATRAAAQLEPVAKAAQHNRFVEIYLRYDAQAAAGDPAAAATLDELRATARPGRQSELIEALSRAPGSP